MPPYCPQQLPLTKNERRFARKLGWTGITMPHNPAQWYYTRPDGRSCGWQWGCLEIRQLRTKTFLNK